MTSKLITALSGVDEKNLQDVAHSKSCQDEQRCEGAHTQYAISLSNAPSKAKRVKNSIVFALVSVMCYLLFGCDNAFQLPKDTSGAIPAGYGMVAVTMTGAARTVFPTQAFEKIEYKFAKVTNGTPGTPVAQEPEGGFFTLELGDWQVTVTAYAKEDDTEPAATGTSATFTVGNTTATVTVQLAGNVEAGEGTFSYHIEYPDGAEITVFSLENLLDDTVSLIDLTPINGEADEEDDTIVILSGTYDEGIPAGIYWLTIQLKKDGVTNGVNEAVYIYGKLDSAFSFTFEESHFTNFIMVTNGDNDGVGSLRRAISVIPDGGTIRIDDSVTTITLTSGRLSISRSLTIEGNGVTITRDPSQTINNTSQLLYISGADITVSISRVWFKDGRTTGDGAAINIGINVNLSLESCIFSGNQNSSTSIIQNGGGALYNGSGNMSVKGCTFYGNSANNGSGGAICTTGGTLTLEGNLFYGNTAQSYRAVSRYNSPTITSLGYNVVDAALGNSATTQSGFAAASNGTDKGDVSVIPVSPVSFKLLSGSAAAEFIKGLSVDYPAIDFYGNAISASDTAPAAAGAVQSAVSGTGYTLVTSVNNSAAGSVSVLPDPDGDGLYSGPVTITATENTGYGLFYWLVNGENKGSEKPLSLNIAAHTTVQAVFVRVIAVTVFTDSSSGNGDTGTLRAALYNAQDGDLIRFDPATAGANTVQLMRALPYITKSITIEGNGVTITRDSSSWTTTSAESQLMLTNSVNATVSISRVHFKDGRATSNGGAIRSNSNLNLESCIFSGNQVSGSMGGALYVGGNANTTVNIKGCTFYGNSANSQGGTINLSNVTLTLEGNLFYENTASSGPPVVYRGSGTVTSLGYNVVDVALGTGNTDSGFASSTINPNTDKTVADLLGANTTSPFIDATNGDFSPSVAILHFVMPATPIEGFPTTDFFGATRTWPGAPGAVQGTAGTGSGYAFMTSVNNNSRGSITSVSPEPDDGLISGNVTITAVANNEDYVFYWLVNGVNAGSENPLSLNITAHTAVQAVFLTPQIGVYLFNQTGGNNAGNPVALNPAAVVEGFALGTVTAADSGWQQLLDDIETAGKYVTLDLSTCTMTETAFNPVSSVTTGKNRIVSITLPNSATSIQAGTNNAPTFSGFTALTSFSGAGLTSIGDYAFYGIASLTMTSLPSGVTTIGNNAFQNCTYLALSSLPEGVTSIGAGAFWGCTNLALTSLPTGVTSINAYAFYNCTGLTQITLPTTLTSIGDSAFYNCRGLTQITLPTTLTSIGADAFTSCTGLTQITLPSTLTSIGNSAFIGCNSLATVICLAVSPPTLGTTVFPNATQQIKVPLDSVEAYKAATNWSSYASRIVAIE